MIRTLPMMLLCMALPALADDAVQPVATIRAVAESAIAGGPGALVQASIDARLRMPRCSATLTAMPSNAATVEVACPDPAGTDRYASPAAAPSWS
jgi:hypothetical protein